MSFIADQQTLSDLNILGKYKPDSVFSLFNRCRSHEGERLLEEIFRQPLAAAADINRRYELLQYFQHKQLVLPFNGDQLNQVSEYLNAHLHSNAATVFISIARKKIMQGLVRDQSYTHLQKDIFATVNLLRDLELLTAQLDVSSPFAKQVVQLHSLFEQKDIRRLLMINKPALQDFSLQETVRYHQILTGRCRENILQAMEIIWQMDVYIAISDVARERGFALAKALGSGKRPLKLKRLFHPQLPVDKAVGNDLLFDEDSNILFLTGANMAGKSTLMKAFGIAMYLGHIGLPVAAESMEFPVMEGLYSSINVPDSLAQGYSHFYAEVLRVKKVAEDVSSGKKLLVVFDELFKGTNVRDAYDATLAVTKAFAAYQDCIFIISTHIIEVGHALQQTYANLQYAYLPTVMEGNIPRYTYRLTAGITSDRQGMRIIENERILELLQ